jgi:hypothetical protein
MKLKKWHRILIGVFAVIVVLGFAVVVYMFKTPSPDLPTNANFFDKVFNFLDDWASAGAPVITLLAIIVSLIIGIKSLRQTKNIQQNETNQRLLKEIEEWAKGVIRLISRLETYEEKNLQNFRFNTESEWKVLEATAFNMIDIAGKIDKDFGKKVNEAILDFHLLWQGIQPGGALKSNIYNPLQKCKDSCTRILESTGELKFQEIR